MIAPHAPDPGWDGLIVPAQSFKRKRVRRGKRLQPGQQTLSFAPSVVVVSSSSDEGAVSVQGDDDGERASAASGLHLEESDDLDDWEPVPAWGSPEY